MDQSLLTAYDMNTQLISIIMPAYNAEKYIAVAIQSVLHQIYENWELLIINDGSTDDTDQCIKAFSDQRIRYFVQENKGVSQARNVGLDNMKGTYFCFLDADDEMPPKSISARMKIFGQYPELNFVDGSVKSMNASLSKTIIQWTPQYRGNPLDELMRLSGKVFFGPTWMIKRTSHADIRFETNLTHGEDLLFFLDYGRMESSSYFYTSEVILNYRTETNSAMSNLDGLGRGYMQMIRLLSKRDIASELISKFEKKTKSIMFKSFMAKGRIIDAIKYYF